MAVSRRRVLAGSLGLAGAGLAAGCGAREGGSDATAAAAASDVVAFRGPHQAGISTAAQPRLAFAAFDVLPDAGVDRAQLHVLMRTWTAAAEKMTRGEPVGDSASELAPPRDTGEAAGLPASHLTVTVGLGPSLFDDRFGLAGRRPAALADLPAFAGDALEPARTGGDLCVQACADDPTVAFHAVRNLARLGRGTIAMRWFQLGFGRTSSTSTAQETERNLMGFKDGTNNLKAEDAASLDQHVWVGSEGDQDWMTGGSYLVARRIRMRIESWDRAALGEQERVIGRFRASGAPLTGVHEHDTVDLDASDGRGRPVIDAAAHVRLASPSANGGARLLRRGYSYTDGIDPATGELDAGLFFIAFQRDPREGFVRVQRRLGVHDALSEYLQHTGSGLFACPPGVGEGESWAEALLA